MAMLHPGVTKPAPGVMHTSPATAPTEAPTLLDLPFLKETALVVRRFRFVSALPQVREPLGGSGWHFSTRASKGFCVTYSKAIGK